MLADRNRKKDEKLKHKKCFGGGDRRTTSRLLLIRHVNNEGAEPGAPARCRHIRSQRTISLRSAEVGKPTNNPSLSLRLFLFLKNELLDSVSDPR